MRNIYVVPVLLSLLAAGCNKPDPTQERIEQELQQREVIRRIELLKPEDNLVADLREVDQVVFQWEPLSGESTYRLMLSRNPDLSSPRTVAALKNPLVVECTTMDQYLKELGMGPEATADIYWSVQPWGGKGVSDTLKMTLTRMNLTGEKHEVADPITAKVAVLYEDLEVPGTGGKRMHEVFTTPPWGFGWREPHKQCAFFKRYLEEASHGIMKIEIVKEIEGDRFFSYLTPKNKLNPDQEKKYVWMDTLATIFRDGPIPGLGEGIEYDYEGMLSYYGFDKMVNNGEITEIWLFSHPCAGCYETRMCGPGSFWCNSPGLQTPLLNKKVIVQTGCYEREIALSLHAFNHRVESIMSQVYGFNLNNKGSKSQLNNWERFCGYTDNYSRFDTEACHIGFCHFPPNAHADYEYANEEYVNTYADEWMNYPDVPERKFRKVNREEWKSPDPTNHPGDYQLGYMMWYQEHLPHFKGINQKIDDLHLNNWWYYIIDYDSAIKYERELQMSL